MGSASSVQTARHLAVANLINKPTDLSDIGTMDEAKAELMNLRSLAYEFRYELSAKLEGGDDAMDVEEGGDKTGGKKDKGKGKRKNVMGAKGENTDTQATTLPPSHAKTKEVREMLMGVVAHNILFRSCPREERTAIVDVFEKCVFQAEEFVIRKGEKGDHFYVVDQGVCSAWDNGQKVGKVLDHGICFGELALMYNQPRAIDIKAQTEVVLWRIERMAYKQIVLHFKQKRMSQSLHMLESIKVNDCRLGDTLDKYQLQTLVSALEREAFAEGDVIIRQGSHGDHFYIIEHGAVGVHIEDMAGVSNKVSVLNKGDYFGEKALLSEDLRAASIIAENLVECLTLSRQDFIALVGTVQEAAKNGGGGATEDDVAAASVESSPSKGTEAVSSEGQLTLTDAAIQDFDDDNAVTVGSGMFATIKVCKHKESGVFYALKCQSKALLSSHNLQDNVSKEISNHRSCSGSSPCIVKLYGVFQDKFNVYHALEYLEGGELYDYLSKNNVLDVTKVRFYSACYLLALKELHARKIAYRDTKPENMCFNSQGYLKLVDFGMAKKLDHSKTFTICGTPDYIAPEVILVEGHNHAVDYWGLGVLIFEMIKGRPPFFDAEDNAVKIYEKILENDIEGQMTGRGSPFGKDLSSLLTKLLCSNQTKRLGNTRKGTDGVLNHKWYNNLNISQLARGALQAPYMPLVKAPGTGSTDHFPDFDEAETPELCDADFALIC
jgi:CRP-like cAMP-binding protein